MARYTTHRLFGWGLLTVWTATVVVGASILMRYKLTPGESPVYAAAHWPADLGIDREPHGALLFMTVHPRCPCSHASISQLERLQARARDRISIHVLFVAPAGAPHDWADGDLWDKARQIPAVTLHVDRDGAAARQLGAKTSGHVFCFDSEHNLVFSGGITPGRGHEGNAPGFDSIMSFVRTGSVSTSRTPVYGCPLGVFGASAADSDREEG